MTKVFVYGSLKKGRYNHRILGDSKMLTTGFVHGYQLMDLGAFPGAVPTGDELHVVYGEVYEVDDATFRRLDILEGYPDFYDRVQLPVYTKMGGGIIEDVWMYVYKARPWVAQYPYPIVEGGNW